MASGCVKLRDDLVISRQEKNGQTIFVVKDPEARRFFRFGEIEGFVLQQLDGVTPAAVVCERVEQQFNTPLSEDGLAQFVDRLCRAGLAAENGHIQPAPSVRQGRVRGDLFYLRLKAFDPDRLFDRLVHPVRFFFSPSFVWLSAASIALALWITMADWPELSRAFRGLYRPAALALAWITLLLVIAAHEFAHGLTCKHFGGRVHELGAMLILFQPAFYCDVSDAWLFPEKSRRLWVTFAGAYFEMFLWAVAIFTWRLTDPSSWINYLALVIVATSGIKTMFNLNPLIKLDGYYLLSDLLEIPNLQRRAFGYLKDRLGLLWGATPWRVPDATPRERRIYLVYGLLSWTFIVWILSHIALWFGGHLTAQYQGWGFILFASLLTGVFRRPLKRAVQAPLALVGRGLVSPNSTASPSPAASLQGNEQSPPNSASRRVVRGGFKRPLGFLTGMAALIAGMFLWNMELKVSGPFVIRPVHNADVRAEVEGIIETIHCDMGDLVHAGDPIARLSGDAYQAELQKTLAEIGEKQAQRALLEAGPRPEEVNLAKTRIARAEEQFKYAKSRLDRDDTLFKKQLISRKEFEQSQETAAVREKELNEARSQLKALLAGSRQEERDMLDAEIRGLEAQQRFLEDQWRSLTVISPVTGIVTTSHLKEKTGQYVKKGDLIAEVHDLSAVTAEIQIPEKEIADVKTGQPVVLKAMAYPAANFYGTVTAVAPVATEQQDAWNSERTVLVLTQFANTPPLLKPGMSGNAKIRCGKQRVVDLITRRLARFIRVEFWSWW